MASTKNENHSIKENAEMVRKEVEEAAEGVKTDMEEMAADVKADAREVADSMKADTRRSAASAKEKVQKKASDVKKKVSKKVSESEEVAAIRAKRQKLRDSAAARRDQFRSGAKEMSEDLRQLLDKEISAMKHREKRRSAEMISIFAKHNFYAGGFTPVELRTTLEDLGPTYVKIGQIMSSRVDMLPESYCKELEKLRQNVKPLDASVARAVIEQETGKKIEEIYSEFNDDPLGSASIGQVHSGTLLDGTKVVTKVQRPLIADMMRKDFVLLKKIASAVKTVNEGNENAGEQLDLLAVIEELEKVTNEELDFRVEAANTVFFKENCIEDETKITCPTIFPDLTTERIMTMTFVDGYSVSKRDRIIEDGYDPNEIGAAILDNYVHQVLDIGTFHGDPHQGNIMVSKGVPTWIDFGMIGRLTEANIRMIQDLILSLVQTDTEALVNAALAMGAGSAKTSREKLSQDLDALISKYMSVTNLNELDTAALLEDVMNAMSDNYITIPGEYTMLVRSIATIEGVIEQLCPELNLFELITNKLLERAKKSFNLQQTLISAGKDTLAVGKKASKIPVLAYDALNSVTKGRTKVKFELTGYEELMNQVNDTVRYIIFALFSCVLFFGSCILCTTDIQPMTVDGIPLLAVAGFIFSVALAVYTVKKMSQKR